MEREFRELLRLLPDGWEEKAKELGALTRRRKVKSAEELPRLVLLYVTEGGSFAGTKALLEMSGEEAPTKWAISKRIGRGAEWLKWLCENICLKAGLLARKPAWLEGREVYVLDASETVTGGARKKYYLLHYCVDLFTLAMREMALTGIKEGEKVSNFKRLGAGDIVIGDRIYGTIPGIEYARGRGSAFILRLRGRAFALYEESGEKTDLMKRMERLKYGEYYEEKVYYKKDGELKGLRIRAARKDEKSEEAGIKRIKKENQRKRGGREASAGRIEYNKYILVATSLGEEAGVERIMELYRMRWRIELAFKRLKSLFQYGEVPSKLDENARARFYGKPLLSALSETLVNEGRFSPPPDGEEEGSRDI
jgi:hypothetical protein